VSYIVVRDMLVPSIAVGDVSVSNIVVGDVMEYPTMYITDGDVIECPI